MTSAGCPFHLSSTLSGLPCAGAWGAGVWVQRRQRVGRRSPGTLDEVPVDTGPTSRCSASPEETPVPCAGLTCAKCRAHLGWQPLEGQAVGLGWAGVGEALLRPALSWHRHGCCRDPFLGRSEEERGPQSSPLGWRSLEPRKPRRRTLEGFSSRGPPATPPVRDSRVCPAQRCAGGAGNGPRSPTLSETGRVKLAKSDRLYFALKTEKGIEAFPLSLTTLHTCLRVRNYAPDDLNACVVFAKGVTRVLTCVQ